MTSLEAVTTTSPTREAADKPSMGKKDLPKGPKHWHITYLDRVDLNLKGKTRQSLASDGHLFGSDVMIAPNHPTPTRTHNDAQNGLSKATMIIASSTSFTSRLVLRGVHETYRLPVCEYGVRVIKKKVEEGGQTDITTLVPIRTVLIIIPHSPVHPPGARRFLHPYLKASGEDRVTTSTHRRCRPRSRGSNYRS